ncbi:hypothetical protein SBOR_6420 [Sclerotinia borealis F-4128]|uniref:Aminoglycoside phosphotransferase domain-containing protein n=1 Tax=Sclerotinia borealis (strain F-4128) TaxID=1432307 RepID=W9CBI9_SCLBF|nr:hypothetical protein SBOR_6420 [Sclerotinia borealis F-4128]
MSDLTDQTNERKLESAAALSLSKPVNNTRFRRFLVLASIKIVKHFRRNNGVLNISSGICVKYGQLKTLAEASAMKFIGEHTSIPVPKTYCSFVHKGRTYIVMEMIRGDYMGRGWVYRTPESKARIHSQLRDMIAEMRRLVPTTSRIANVDGGILLDGRIMGPMQFGPFENTNEFHRYLRGGLHEHSSKYPEGVNELIDWHDGPWPAPPVFTHGDLSSLNILADGDKVVGIVDWETAGCIPPIGSIRQRCTSIRETCFGRKRLTNSWIQYPPRKLWRRFGKDTLGIAEPRSTLPKPTTTW